MRRRIKIFALTLTAALAFTLALALALTGGAATEEPTLSINLNTISLRDSICVKYAVEASGASGVELLIWDAPRSEYLVGTQTKRLSSVGSQNINGVPHLVYELPGLSARQMADQFYARAYVRVDGVDYYSDLQKYSILQYARDVIEAPTTTEKHKRVVSEMLDYGALAQKNFSYNASRPANADFRDVTVVGGLLSDGTPGGLYLAGETVSLVAAATDSNGIPFLCWENSKGETVSSVAVADVIAPDADEVYTAIYSETATLDVLDFTLLSDGSYSVSAKSGVEMPERIIIPKNYSNALVTAIGDGGFEGLSSIADISIPSSVRKIGYHAFYGCSGLVRLTLPVSLETVGTDAFGECYRLAEVVNNSDFDVIAGRSALGGVAASATEVHGGESRMDFVGDYAFYTYNGINYLVAYTGDATTVTLPASYGGEGYSIRKNAFRGLTGLVAVTVPAGVSAIGESAFEGCSGITSLSLSSGIQSIEPYAFAGCSGISAVGVPNTVSHVGDYAFLGCITS